VAVFAGVEARLGARWAAGSGSTGPRP
jgi:hypothetical protein